MKKTQPSFNNNLPALNVLSVELAAAVAGGNTGAATDVTKTTTPINSNSTAESPAIPGGNGGRPPFV
jgi:hypothetical protein